MKTPKKFAVLGDPIQHSQSPFIHQLFAKQFDLDITYEKIQTTHQALESTLQQLQVNHYSGVNLTSPLKELALPLVDELSEYAAQVKSINTITFEKNGKRKGDNTDGVGLQKDFLRHNIFLKNKNILILGAGGAVRGILPILLAGEPRSLSIYNRTVSRVVELAKDFPTLLQSVGDPQFKSNQYDICINALPIAASLPQFKNFPSVYYDLKYHNVVYPNFPNNSVYTACGVGLVIEQAAEAFYQWHLFRPDTKHIYNLLTYSP